MNKGAEPGKRSDREEDDLLPAGRRILENGVETLVPRSRAGVLHARRRFLVGSVGFSAFAATLASRPAFAGDGGGGCGPITALCSPTHSGSHQKVSCTGYHCDYWCTNKTRWPVNCDTATFSSCGFEPPPGCNFSGGDKLKDAICSAYLPNSGQNNWNQTYGRQNNFNQQYGSQGKNGGGSNYSGGWWSYNSGCDTDNLQCWIACGLLNAISPETCGAFGYDKDSFNNACQTVLNYKNSECYTDIHVALCATISSICTQHRNSYPCGGPNSVWS
jgi:hypothetical protein